MSTTSTPSTPSTPSTGRTTPTLDFSGTPGVPFTRLVSVELRKALDTRAGRWFSASIVLLCLVVVTIFAFAAPEGGKDFGDVLGVAGATLGYFLPILLILMVTSEWSQRTGLTTFTLEPHRGRVIGAKFCAGLILGVGAHPRRGRGGRDRHRDRRGRLVGHRRHRWSRASSWPT